jgi:MoxR-like ATPase
MLSLFSASNHLPEDDALQALFDRFLLRCHVGPLRREAMPQLLAAGWALEQTAMSSGSISAGDLQALSERIRTVDLSPVTSLYGETVFKIRDLGIAFSDRRAIKVLKLLAASALLCGRAYTSVTDFWVLRYVWDREEQIDSLAALVNGILEQHKAEERAHPLSALPQQVDAEEISLQLDGLERELTQDKRSLTTLARIRERIADLADKAAWIPEQTNRKHLLERASAMLERLG